MEWSRGLVPSAKTAGGAAWRLLPCVLFLVWAPGCSDDDDPAAPDPACIEARIFRSYQGNAELHRPVVFRTTGPTLGEDDFASVSLSSPSQSEFGTTLVFTTPSTEVSFTPDEAGVWLYKALVIYGGHPVGVSGGGFLVTDLPAHPRCWVNYSLEWERMTVTRDHIEQVVSIFHPPDAVVLTPSRVVWVGPQGADSTFLDPGTPQSDPILVRYDIPRSRDYEGDWEARVFVLLGCSTDGFPVNLPFAIAPRDPGTMPYAPRGR